MTTAEAAKDQQLKELKAARAALDQLTDIDIHLDLGDAEVARRMQDLADWQKYETIASYLGLSPRDKGMTPAQVRAWALFADSLGKDIIVAGSELQRRRPDTKLAETVVHDERSRRQRIADLRIQRAEGKELGSWDARTLEEADKADAS